MDGIFITGAGAGIGLATARLFAANGWFVGAADRDGPALQSLERELGAGRCSIHTLDVTDAAAVREALAAFATHTGGKLRVLHNNAGVIKVGAFEEIGIEEHRRMVEVNVIGLLNVLHAAFPYLRDTPNAQVVNMSSSSAAYGTPDFATYSASKHAVRAMTEALDIEWERYGIRVGDLMPSFVKTGMIENCEASSGFLDKLGVHLSAEDVAQEVWSLVHKPCVHRLVSGSVRSFWRIAHLAPASVTRGILKRIWGR